MEAEEVLLVWNEYKATGDIGSRNQLVVHYAPMVRTVANKVGGTLPSMVDRDDLVSYGTFGLIDAIAKFDPGKGVKFETYGPTRVRGAMYDELRKLNWVPRSILSKARDVELARSEVEALLGRPPKHNEIADHLGLTIQEYWALSSKANVRTVGVLEEEPGDYEDGHYGSYAPDPVVNLQQTLEVGEIIELVSGAISQMDERSKMILVLYYLHEMTLAEIGVIFGVTESRVCQMQSKVLTVLGEALGEGHAAA